MRKDPEDGDRITLLQGVPAAATLPGLDKVEDVFQRALAAGLSRSSLDLARSLLASIEQECSVGRPVPASALAAASVYSVRLAGATLDGSWIDAVFRIHHARGAVLPVEVVDALYILLRRIRVDFLTFSKYLHAMNECRSEMTPAERFALRRTEGLVALLRR